MFVVERDRAEIMARHDTIKPSARFRFKKIFTISANSALIFVRLNELFVFGDRSENVQINRVRCTLRDTRLGPFQSLVCFTIPNSYTD